ncbi:hypothetical protein BH23ACT10_BH23ACT10_25310 [soil metagenome]
MTQVRPTADDRHGAHPLAVSPATGGRRGASRGAAPAPRDTSPTPHRRGMLAQAGLIAWRDLSPGVAGRRTTFTVAPLSVAVLVLAGLAFGTDPAVVDATAAPLVWLVVLLATVPLARSVAADDAVDGCWSLLRGVVDPAALFVGKLWSQWALLGAAWAVTTALAAVLLGVAWPPVALVGGALGTLGLAAVTTVLGLLLLDDHGHGAGPLSVLVLPIGLPLLLAGARLTAPGAAAAPWLALLVSYDAVLLAVAWATFPMVVEGS